MYAYHRAPAVGVLLLAAAMAGCDDGAGPELPADFDPVAVESAVDALLTTLRAAYEPGVALTEAFDTLADQGVTFDREPGTDPVNDRPRTGTAAVEFPQEFLGRTFVYSPDSAGWYPDDERTGAPADGIRIIWYSTDPSGSILLPLEERGFVDATDQDEPDLSQLGVRMVETDAGNRVLADFTQGYRRAGDVSWTEHAEAAGFFADADRTVDFELASDAAGNTDTGHQEAALAMTIEDAEITYTLDVDLVESAGAGTAQQDLAATALLDGHVNALELTITQESGLSEGEGTLSFDGEVIVLVTVQGSTFRYRDTDGETLTTSSASRVDRLVRTLYLAGISFADRLPLLF